MTAIYDRPPGWWNALVSEYESSAHISQWPHTQGAAGCGHIKYTPLSSKGDISSEKLRLQVRGRSVVPGAGGTLGGDLAADPGSASGRFSPVSTAWAVVSPPPGWWSSADWCFPAVRHVPGPLTPWLWPLSVCQKPPAEVSRSEW